MKSFCYWNHVRECKNLLVDNKQQQVCYKKKSDPHF
jgi:hypothetical protein